MAKKLSSLRLLSPAKINLFLHITGRRADGYHELQTLFQLLDYGDELEFNLRADGQISLSPQLPDLPAEKNLIVRAAKLLKERTKCPLGIDIKLNKYLPMGGGLGGGSSNAATTLIALNHLWSTGLNKQELAEIGIALGADVPVFVHGKTAWAEGVGEHIQPLELDKVWYCVLAPRCHVSTAEIFSQKDLTRDTSAITIPAFLNQGGKNDCQLIVERLYPEVAEAVKWLNQFAPAKMTGTGACVFAPFSSQTAARVIFEQRPSQFGGFVAEGINTSPLCELL